MNYNKDEILKCMPVECGLDRFDTSLAGRLALDFASLFNNY